MAYLRGFGPGRSLFAIFSLLSLLPVLALGALLAAENRQQAQERGIAQARAQAEVIARLIGETQLDGHDLTSGLNDRENQQISAFAANEAHSGAILRLRLRAPSQQVIFSSDDSPVPTAPDDEVEEALNGEPVAEITHLNADIGAGPAGERSVESYVAIRTPETGAAIGVLEIYLPYEAIAADVQRGLNRLYLALGLGLALLYLVLAGLSGWTTRRLSHHAARYQYLASYDPLTGLPNRTLFAERLATTALRHEPAAVVFLDLDRFREVNDTLGHHNGDLLLVQIATRLKAAIGPADTVARLGGDEFGLVMPAIAGPEQLLQRLGPIRAALEEEIELAGLPLGIEAAFGVVLVPRDGSDAEIVGQRADIALNAAKQRHGGIAFYDPSQDHFNPHRLALGAELRRAIARDELTLVYQPQVHQPSGDVNTVEALVRWNHPTHGLLVPDAFIPVAEQTALIDDLTGWVLNAALAQVQAWHRAGVALTVAVNISARNLQDPLFPHLVVDALERLGLPPTCLVLEITETALISDMSYAATILDRLSMTGLGLSLDDFGQGFTSLSQLSRLPLDELKIDKSFVMNMQRSPEDAAIVRSVIDLAHNLGLRVVAEGVEDDQAFDALHRMGCDVVQGYLFARPLPPEHVITWLDDLTNSVPSRAT